MKLGPVMVDVAGLELTPDDIERLQHPQVGGVILFARNFAAPLQLIQLTHSIRELRKPSLLIAVDHEGGRVQRFKHGFTAIPAMRQLGQLWDHDPAQALAAARGCGFVMGSELQAHGVDFTFAPVLDADHGESAVIGDRALHRDPNVIAVLAEALQAGLQAAGMASVGKHFPGHGFVQADSHLEVPTDSRTMSEIAHSDLIPFQRLARSGMGGMMPAHVIYTKIDSKPAGFSSVWLQKILREKLGFEGLIFSDDLAMEGASTAGGMVARANAALNAGCDMVLICNDPRAQDTLLEGLERRPVAPTLVRRLDRMRGKAISTAALKASAAYLAAAENLARVRQG
ncbi:beta-N-acetylhexosaminidase [Usitatibacter palustris]|uniref:Beta-hexosaminidase n=1 Tax=Usitatibacter palustris TaxID=2732487 RepID=A0A6M4H911_9PROT|nr:beta-N-acetylhexosaminidase [Usitatibacter palustris]QJR15298.1 Beta-hexosaminidase [Usitatibacter palustris]